MLKNIFCKIMSNEQQREKLNSLEDKNQIYKLFCQNGYTKSFDEFSKEMEVFLNSEESKKLLSGDFGELSEEMLEMVAGGVNIKRITLAGLLTACAIVPSVGATGSKTNFSNASKPAQSISTFSNNSSSNNQKNDDNIEQTNNDDGGNGRSSSNKDVNLKIKTNALTDKVNNLLDSGSIPNDVEFKNFSDEYNNMMEFMKTNLSEEEMNNFLSNYEEIYKNLSKYEKPIQDAINNKNPQDMQATFKQIKSDVNLKFRENLLNRAENLIDKIKNIVGDSITVQQPYC